MLIIAAGQWFSQGNSTSSETTDRHDINEIMLNVALDTINHKPKFNFHGGLRTPSIPSYHSNMKKL